MADSHRDAKGKFLPGHKFGSLPPKPGKRRRGAPKKEEQTFSKRFLEDVILQKYSTAWGAVSALEELLEQLPPGEQAKVHMRLLELGARIVPKDLRVTQGHTVTLRIRGLSAACPSCGAEVPSEMDYVRPSQKPIDVIPSLPGPAPSLPEPVRSYKPGELCPGLPAKEPVDPEAEAIRRDKAEQAALAEQYEEQKAEWRQRFQQARDPWEWGGR